MTIAEWCSAATAYDALAANYDVLTAHHDHALWVDAINACLVRHGVVGDTLLDLGCGTGRSTAAWRDAGYRVTGADSSAAMLAHARARVPSADLHHADLRDLGDIGTFAVVSCMCDVMNCVSAAELPAALAAIAGHLAHGGLLVFDANTRNAYRRYFSVTEVAVDTDAAVILWRGGASGAFAPGDTARLTIDAFNRDEAGAWTRSTSVQEQHHHTQAAIEEAIARAGLTLVDVYGQDFEAVPERPLDEDRHIKGMYIARRGEEVTTCSQSTASTRSLRPRPAFSRAAETHRWEGER